VGRAIFIISTQLRRSSAEDVAPEVSGVTMHTTPSKTARTNFMTHAFDCELPPDTLSKIVSGQIEPNI
jgi:hypothetical protein